MDTLISKSENFGFDLTTYRKPTNTGLLTNFRSFVPFAYKFGLVKTLFDRASKINTTELGFAFDKCKILEILKKNCFPNHVINRVKNSSRLVSVTEGETKAAVENVRCFKLPFTGSTSIRAKKKIEEIASKFCKQVPKFKIVFTSFKIGSYFSTKDQIPSDEICNVVYKFKCAGCNACYIGETTRCFKTRGKEHLESDKNSSIFKHLQNEPTCKATCSLDCFEILDKALTPYQLKIKEALHIGKEQPVLNRQVKSLQVTMVL